MDILISSNLERMLYYMSDKDTRLIAMLMNDLNQWGAYEGSRTDAGQRFVPCSALAGPMRIRCVR